SAILNSLPVCLLFDADLCASDHFAGQTGKASLKANSPLWRVTFVRE
ncbi:MAG: hypothetical protein QOG25_2316, partial [Acetobacteraceae bacterium]|nr:hypothetical protein [Acetobacteraceae bacterium]